MKKHKVKRPSQLLLHSPFAILRDIVSALTIPGIVPKTSFYVQWRWKWGSSLFQKEHPRNNPTSFLLCAAIYQTLRYRAYHGALTQKSFIQWQMKRLCLLYDELLLWVVWAPVCITFLNLISKHCGRWKQRVQIKTLRNEESLQCHQKK